MLFGLFLLGLIPIMMAADALIGDPNIDPDGELDDTGGEEVSYDASDTGGIDALLEAAPQDFVATEENMPLVLDDFEPGSDKLTLQLAPDQMDIAEAETDTGGVAIVEGGDNLLVEFPNLDWVPDQDVSIIVEDPETNETIVYDLVEIPVFDAPPEEPPDLVFIPDPGAQTETAPEPEASQPAPVITADPELGLMIEPILGDVEDEVEDIATETVPVAEPEPQPVTAPEAAEAEADAAGDEAEVEVPEVEAPEVESSQSQSQGQGNG